MISSSLLLDLLRDHPEGFVSGEELSSRLGVSRTAVWKHVHQLEEAGYRIAAVPHLGYRLMESPDRLLPDEIQNGLATRLFGRRVYCYQETSSTNDRALERAAAGDPEGTLVAAESQTRGRGRNRRQWLSKPHANLLFSLILRPDWPIERAPWLTLLLAVAVARAIRQETGLPARIKWPNDIIVRRTKVAGILTEMQATGDRVIFMVCGVGINVNAAPAGVMKNKAASLAGLRGRTVARLPLLQAVLREAEKLYLALARTGLQPVLEAWRALSCMEHTPVTIELATGERSEGTALGIDETGALLVRLENGLTRRFSSGEVSLLFPDEPTPVPETPGARALQENGA